MNEYTPGPWYARRSVPGQTYEENYISIVNFSEGRPSDEPGRWLIAEIDAEHTVDEANAQLIAAAPDMLTALEDSELALELIIRTNGLTPNQLKREIQNVRAAMNKAIAIARGSE